MNCAECGQPATVLSGDVPHCGTCFYKHSLEQRPHPAEPVNLDVWRRLTEAIAALETLVSRISGEVEELVKKRRNGDS
ncbi:MAG TPA: hypothetical protein VGK04_01670 [Thermoanaerobaculia bacterium]